METSKERWHLVFSGQVQHVGFRYTAYYLARSLELTGWVDNLPDGRVEMEIQGPVTQLRRLLLALKDRPHIRIAETEIRRMALREQERRFTVGESPGLWD